MEHMFETHVNQVVQGQVGSAINELALEPVSADMMNVPTEIYWPFTLEQLNQKRVTVWEMAWKNYHAAGETAVENERRLPPIEGWNESLLNACTEPESMPETGNILMS